MMNFFHIILFTMIPILSFSQETSSIKFKVRVGACKRIPNNIKLLIDRNEYQYKTILACYNNNTIYRVDTKSYKCYNEALLIKEQLNTKGYRDAFVISFEGSERIPIEKARKKNNCD